MTSLIFPDVNVWLAMSFTAHIHHVRAKIWFDSLQADEELIFCRITQLGLLRLLTNAIVMGNRVKTQREAWTIYDAFLAYGNARFTQEPRSTDQSFRRFATLDAPSPKSWTDDYLAAFAEAGDLQLVTFDKTLAAKARGAILLKP